MSKLIMMAGIPGSGKSTWIREHKAKADLVISRDEIRFSMLREGEDYFAHEDTVIESFLNKIEVLLFCGETVWADATHLNRKARKRVLDRVGRFADEIECVWIDTELDTAIERNDKREGRARVPRGVIRRMFFSMEPPEEEEGFDKITIIEEGYDEKVVD